jgi:hypothetical protein
MVSCRSIKARTFLEATLTAAGKNQLLLDVPLTTAALTTYRVRR